MAKKGGGLPKAEAAYCRELLKRVRAMEQLTRKVFAERIAPIFARLEDAVARETGARLAANASRLPLLDELSGRLADLYRSATLQAGTELAALNEAANALFSHAFASGLAKDFIGRLSFTSREEIGNEILTAAKHRASPLPETKLRSIDLLADKGIDGIVRGAVSDNVALIKSIPAKHFEAVEKAVRDGLAEGRTLKEVGREISEIGGVSERRGQFIARDQAGSAYGNLSTARKQSLGLKKFKWITSHDERVRDSHRALDGRVFELATGATGPGVAPEAEGLHPGEDFNCRCTEASVLEDILEMLDGL
ncbi:MAG: minor capsid protein [Clostridiales bacterium]|jgi:SPP1 gp7 family putative phage head morphogenesis protein|nr:minor capsid protein [Clostridiales bacterium]